MCSAEAYVCMEGLVQVLSTNCTIPYEAYQGTAQSCNDVCAVFPYLLINEFPDPNNLKQEVCGCVVSPGNCWLKGAQGGPDDNKGYDCSTYCEFDLYDPQLQYLLPPAVRGVSMACRWQSLSGSVE